MTAAAKAIALIEREAAEHGGYPASIAITEYPSAEIYAQHRPDENYEQHLAEVSAVIAWCEKHGIAVERSTVTTDWPERADDRAEKAAREHWKRPYRLGLSIGGTSGLRDSTSAIGWFAVAIGAEKMRKGEL